MVDMNVRVIKRKSNKIVCVRISYCGKFNSVRLDERRNVL